MRTFEIYFHMLNEKAQKEFLEFQRVDSPEELNPELCPLAIIETEN